MMVAFSTKKYNFIFHVSPSLLYKIGVSFQISKVLISNVL
ncbi:hypothetical protein CHCC20491_0180 [Bacillus paralicheniformis]|nr:hypothetical protein CHCC20491_0180 [Bacillus paralicheniformis]